MKQGRVVNNVFLSVSPNRILAHVILEVAKIKVNAVATQFLIVGIVVQMQSLSTSDLDGA